MNVVYQLPDECLSMIRRCAGCLELRGKLRRLSYFWTSHNAIASENAPSVCGKSFNRHFFESEGLMAFRFFNPNPKGRFVGDCTIRALCKLLNQDWDSVYAATTFQGFLYKDMPSGNSTWGAYLYKLGYKREFIPDNCLGWYSVKDFCRDHSIGSFLLVLDQHVVTVVDGDYYDTWDSGNELPTYYWVKGE